MRQKGHPWPPDVSEAGLDYRSPHALPLFTLQVTTCVWLPKVKFSYFRGFGDCGEMTTLEIDPDLPSHTSVVFLEINTQLLGSGDPISTSSSL